MGNDNKNTFDDFFPEDPFSGKSAVERYNKLKDALEDWNRGIDIDEGMIWLDGDLDYLDYYEDAEFSSGEDAEMSRYIAEKMEQSSFDKDTLELNVTVSAVSQAKLEELIPEFERILKSHGLDAMNNDSTDAIIAMLREEPSLIGEGKYRFKKNYLIFIGAAEG